MDTSRYPPYFTIKEFYNMAAKKYDYKKMNLDDIIEYCQDNNQIKWLKEIAKNAYKTEEGEYRDITFIELKLAFCKKFMPEIMPVAKPKQPTMIQRIEAL